MGQKPAAQSMSLAQTNVGFIVVCLATMGD